jgi:flagellar protein FliL
MKSKLKFILPVVILALLGAYKFVLAKPAPAAKPKIAGQVYVLPKEFLINLSNGRFAKLSVGLILDEHQSTVAEGAHEAAPPPEGFGTLPQEAVIRDLITDKLTDDDAQVLVTAEGREDLKSALLKSITRKTDVKVEDILFTDVAVQ